MFMDNKRQDSSFPQDFIDEKTGLIMPMTFFDEIDNDPNKTTDISSPTADVDISNLGIAERFNLCIDKLERESALSNDTSRSELPMQSAYSLPCPHTEASRRSKPALPDSYDESARSIGIKLIESAIIVRVGKSIYYYDGRSFVPMEGEPALRLIMQLCDDIGNWIPHKRRAADIFETLKVMPEVPHMPDRSKQFLAMDNGLLDIKSFKIGPNDPSIFTNSRIHANFIANPARWLHPTFDKVLYRCTGGDAGRIQRIKEVFGYLISCEMEGKKFFIFQGVGDSGKSLLINLLISFFEPSAVMQMDFNSIGQKFSQEPLMSVWLCVDDDLPAKKLSVDAASAIKQLTGGSITSAERKGLVRVIYEHHTKFLFATNNMIDVDADEAFWNRLVVVTFPYAVPKNERIWGLDKMLEAERDAIVSEALFAYKALRERNFSFSGNDLPNGLFGVGHMLPSYENLVRDFLFTCCEADPDAWVSTNDLHKAFEAKYSIFISATKFSQLVRLICSECFPGVDKQRDRQGHKNPISGFSGLRLKK